LIYRARLSDVSYDYLHVDNASMQLILNRGIST
jgi:hypothetical protein